MAPRASASSRRLRQKCRTDHAVDGGRRHRTAERPGERVVAAPRGHGRQVGAVGAEKAEDEAVVIFERRASVGGLELKRPYIDTRPGEPLETLREPVESWGDRRQVDGDIAKLRQRIRCRLAYGEKRVERVDVGPRDRRGGGIRGKCGEPGAHVPAGSQPDLRATALEGGVGGGPGRGGAREPLEQRLEAAGPPEVPPESRLARRRRVEPVDGGGQKADIARDRREVVGGEKRREGGEDLRLGLGSGRAEDLEPRLEEFRRPPRARLLLAEDLPGIGVARRPPARLEMGEHDGHGEVGPQHRLAHHRVMGDEGAGADVFAVKVEQEIGGLEDVGLHRLRPGGDEGGPQALRLGPENGLAGHQPRSSIRRTVATRSPSAHSTCAGWSFHSSRVAVSAILAPRTRSLTCTTPRARSSSPWITATGAPRLSAYFNWLPKFLGLPR